METIGDLNEAMREYLWENDYCLENIMETLLENHKGSLHDYEWINSVIVRYLPDSDVTKTWEYKLYDCSNCKEKLCEETDFCKYD